MSPRPFRMFGSFEILAADNRCNDGDRDCYVQQYTSPINNAFSTQANYWIRLPHQFHILGLTTTSQPKINQSIRHYGTWHEFQFIRILCLYTETDLHAIKSASHAHALRSFSPTTVQLCSYGPIQQLPVSRYVIYVFQHLSMQLAQTL